LPSPSDTARHLFLRSHAGTGAARHGPGAYFPDSPKPVFLSGGSRASQVPGRTHCLHALLFDPGGISALLPLATKILPSTHWNGVGSHVALFRGSISRPTDSLCTLRSTGYPNTTQHSVPAVGTLGRAGFVTRWVPMTGFKDSIAPFPLSQVFPGALQIRWKDYH
jgi:hypothetical protein